METFEKIRLRYEELSQLLMQSDLLSDQQRYLKVVQEHAQLMPLIQLFDEQEGLTQALQEAKDLFAQSEDAELRELAREELHALEARQEALTQEIEEAMRAKDPRDERGLILEVRAGAGGEEAALFAAVLLRMYQADADNQGFQTSVLDLNETELGGLKEATMEINGSGAYSRYKFESGVHRVQRVPATESGGRIHTSTCTVAVMPEADEVEVEINPADLRIDTYRASGAGGQHVNKTSSAIRITHLPTNTVVTCQDERSQHKNKDKAMKILRARLYDQASQEAFESEAELRRTQVGTGDRSERIRTYNYPQGRVSDHRIGLTLYKIEEVLAGKLDEFVKALSEAERSNALSKGEQDE